MQQQHNKNADVLATLASTIDEAIEVRIVKMTLWATTADFILTNPIDEQHWRSSVI